MRVIGCDLKARQQTVAMLDTADAQLQVPGRSVQLDVKFVSRPNKARKRSYQLTAADEAA